MNGRGNLMRRSALVLGDELLKLFVLYFRAKLGELRLVGENFFELRNATTKLFHGRDKSTHFFQQSVGKKIHFLL